MGLSRGDKRALSFSSWSLACLVGPPLCPWVLNTHARNNQPNHSMDTATVATEPAASQGGSYLTSHTTGYLAAHQARPLKTAAGGRSARLAANAGAHSGGGTSVSGATQAAAAGRPRQQQRGGAGGRRAGAGGAARAAAAAGGGGDSGVAAQAAAKNIFGSQFL